MTSEDALDDLDGIFDPREKPKPWDTRRVAFLREERGNRCEECGKRGMITKKGRPNLEFAHKVPSTLKGMGRGQTQRYYDIKKNPEKYALLCRSCHRAL